MHGHSPCSWLVNYTWKIVKSVACACVSIRAVQTGLCVRDPPPPDHVASVFSGHPPRGEGVCSPTTKTYFLASVAKGNCLEQSKQHRHSAPTAGSYRQASYDADPIMMLQPVELNKYTSNTRAKTNVPIQSLITYRHS